VAIAGLSATAFTTLGGDVFRSRDTVAPAGGVWHGLDLTKYLGLSGEWSSTGRPGGTAPLSIVGMTTISVVLQRLDPGLGHVRITPVRHRPDTGPASPRTTALEEAGSGYWAPDGDLSALRLQGSGPHPTSPIGYVSIASMGPQVGQEVVTPTKPCGLGTPVGTTEIPTPTAWSPCVRSHQGDGSDIVVTHSVHLAAGTVTVAARVFPDGSSVQVTASTVIGYPETAVTGPVTPEKFVAGPPLNPVPWTDDSLAQVLTGPDVKGLP
jgi:hypothetical protein